jgi:hypothetical protein
MAMSASVTVSMAAETSGMLREMVRVKRVTVSTSRGWTAEYRGTRRTSSKVSPGLGRMMVMRRRTEGSPATPRYDKAHRSLEGMVGRPEQIGTHLEV